MQDIKLLTKNIEPVEKDFVIVEFNERGELQSTAPLKKLFKGIAQGKYILELSKANKRSNPQNRYYWGLVIPLIQQGIGHLGTELTKEETHEFLKARYNFEEIINTETGEAISIPKSTTRLNKSQFSEYIEHIQQFGSQFLNIQIPDPGQQLEICQ